MRLEFREIRKSGRFEAVCNGEIIVRSTRQPIYDGARALLRRGVPPETFVIWLTSEGTPSMRGTLGELAKWTVEESPTGKLQRRRWRPDHRFTVGQGAQD